MCKKWFVIELILQVIAVQQHYVKPQPNELSETVLTEDCKLETGLNEEVIKNAQPLEVVLDEVRKKILFIIYILLNLIYKLAARAKFVEDN